MENAKDVQIGQYTYRINRMKARAGSWVAMQLFTKLLPAAVSPAVERAMPMNGAAKTEMSEEEFANIQMHCLMVCQRYDEQRNASPIMMADGRMLPDLEYDLVTTLALTVNSLVFNIAPFFESDALAKLLGGLEGILPQASASK